MTKEEVIETLIESIEDYDGTSVRTHLEVFQRLLDAFMLVQKQRESYQKNASHERKQDDAEVRALLTQPNLEQGRE